MSPLRSAKRYCDIAVFWVAALAALHAARADAPASPAPADQAITVPASIEPYLSTEVHARASGYISRFFVDIGDRVREGQLLARIDAPELEARLRIAEAELAARSQMIHVADCAIAQSEKSLAVAQKQALVDQAELKLQRDVLERQEEQSAGKTAATQPFDETRGKANAAAASAELSQATFRLAEADMETVRANRGVAQADVKAAQAQVEEAQVLLNFTEIKAPFDGIITRRTANPGDLVQAGTSTPSAPSAPLFGLAQTDSLRLFGEVPQEAVPRMRAGAPAEVRVPGFEGRVFKGARHPHRGGPGSRHAHAAR